MDKIIVSLLFITLYSLSSFGVETDTHLYVVCPKLKMMLVEHKKTHEKKMIPTGRSPYPLVICGTKGYIVNKESGFIQVIDLKQNCEEKRLDVLPGCEAMIIDGDRGVCFNPRIQSAYILDLKEGAIQSVLQSNLKRVSGSFFYNHALYLYEMTASETIISKFDLSKDDWCLPPIEIPFGGVRIVPHKHKGYISSGMKLIIFKLEDGEVLSEIFFNAYISRMVVCKDKGYLFGKTLCVIDLTHDCLMKKTDLEAKAMYFDEALPVGYVIGPSYQTLYSFDLTTYNLKRKVKLKLDGYTSLVHHGGMIYVTPNETPRIYILDALSLIVQHTIDTSDEMGLTFTSGHVYQSIAPIKSLSQFDRPMKLFSRKFSGIPGPLCLYEDTVPYDCFEQELQNETPRHLAYYFKVALRAGDQRAFAVAAYAFLFGRWGASQDAEWFGEFYAACDQAYFCQLIALLGYHF